MIRFQMAEPSALHLFHPPHPRWNAAVFLVRGGDWRTPNAMRALHPLAAACAEHGFPAAVADYPADAKDALEQLAALRQNYQSFQRTLRDIGMPNPRILLFGMGAGAHLGALLACAAPGECGESPALPDPWIPPAAAALLSCPVQFTPWQELFPRHWTLMQDAAGEKFTPGAALFERLSVKNHLDRATPPLFFAEGDEDHLGTAAVSRPLAEALRAAGRPVQWKNYPLAGPSFLSSPLDWKPARMLLADLFRFFEQHAGTEPAPPAAFPEPNGTYGIYLDSPVQTRRGLDLHLPPPGATVLPCALFLVHGGGWRAGDRAKLGALADAFARRGVLAATAGYRLNAHDAFEQLADLREAYHAFAAELGRQGRPPRIAVYGESAGAHLVSLLAATPPGGCGETCPPLPGWTPPAAMILQSVPAQFIPWPDIQPNIWISMEDIAGAPYARDAERYARLSLNRIPFPTPPPTFFAEARYEAVFPPQQIRDLAEQWRRRGVPVTLKRYDAEHGFFHALDRPPQREFLDDIVAFLTKVP